MPRATNSVPSKHRRKKIFESTKGFQNGSNLVTVAKRKLDRALVFAYRDRKQKTRDLKSQRLIRINAVVRLYGMTYSTFRNLLKKVNFDLNSKTLAQICSERPELIGEIIRQAQILVNNFSDI